MAMADVDRSSRNRNDRSRWAMADAETLRLDRKIPSTPAIFWTLQISSGG
jgi:hypothetical protein